MSRISRYQDSMNKFIKNKSCITTLEGNIRLTFNNVFDECDNMVPIILLTVMNSLSKKIKMSLHGYYMGCGIELMMTIARLLDNKTHYQKKLGETSYNRLITKMSSKINICLSQNIEHIQSALTKEKAIKIFHTTLKILNNKLFDLMDEDNIERGDLIKRSDVLKYNFTEIDNPKEILHKIKRAKKDSLTSYIQRKFGSVCQTALILGWILGGGDEKMVSTLEKMGTNLGNIMKISYDFKNLERDLKTEGDTTNNYIINCGIQDGFELFIESKIKFIEGCITLDIYTNTVKEVIDVVETRVELFIDNTVADMKSQYTVFNSKASK
jgi:hypothetical protein